MIEVTILLVIVVVAMVVIGWVLIGGVVAATSSAGGGVSSLPSSSRCEDCRIFFSKWEALSLFQKILTAAYYVLQKLLCIGC